jgi:hypothetical protein
MVTVHELNLSPFLISLVFCGIQQYYTPINVILVLKGNNMDTVFELSGALGNVQCFLESGQFAIYLEACDINENFMPPVKVGTYSDEVEAFAAAKTAVGLEEFDNITLES